MQGVSDGHELTSRRERTSMQHVSITVEVTFQILTDFSDTVFKMLFAVGLCCVNYCSKKRI